MSNRTTPSALIWAVLLACAVGSAMAQNASSYPNRTITIVVPFPAGGIVDLLPRMIAEKLRGTLGQTVVVENKSGASGNICSEQVFRAAADGYTLLIAPQLSFSINHLLNLKLGFDPRAFEPVSVLATFPTVLFARANLAANNVAELVAYARANPGKLTYASQGKGQIAHLTMEALAMLAKVEILHVPYRGSGPALNDLLGGRVDIVPASLLSGLQHVKSGKLKILGVGSRERMPAFPDVPTLAEAVPGLYSDTWIAIAAPPDTPKEITARLSSSIAEVIKMPDINQRIRELEAMPFGSTPDEMRRLIKQSADLWTPVILSAKITPD
jgi:tripartite-type tricarboxylate transporter receptor subunit TctC